LQRRAEDDVGRLADAAHSLGYWSARFTSEIDTTAKPAQVTVRVAPGPLYHVAAVTVSGPSGQPLVLPAGAAPPPLAPGDPARTAPVVAAETALVDDFADAGHPFAKAVGRRIVIDEAARTMSVGYRLDPGPVRDFGPATVTGLGHLDPLYVERRVRWHRGSRYDARLVAKTRQTCSKPGSSAP
jgi:translocation and assembly module TamA